MRFDLVENINTVWNDCLPLIEKSFRSKVHLNSALDYYSALLKEEVQLWIAYDENIIGAVITSIDEGSAAKIMSILSLGGTKIEQWIGIMDQTFTQYALENNCDAIEWVGRGGFTRFVEDYEPDGTVYVKLLGDKNG